MPNNDKIKSQPFRPSWKDSGFDSNLQREGADSVSQGNFITGANFDVNLDEMLFNRMIKLKSLPTGLAPQGADPGKIYWDPTNKKYKLYVNDDVGWVDVQYTSTSTSSTSSSSSSTSTSSTSTSTT